MDEIMKKRRQHMDDKISFLIHPQQLLDGMRTGKFQGFIECDIEIPPTLLKHLNTNLSSEVYYDDYATLFATCMVKFDQISLVMQEHILKQGLNTAPRKAVLSGL